MTDAWPLVGRQDQVEFLTRSLTERRGAVITGELGVGKSRLAREVADQLGADGWLVSWHVATEPRSVVPFAPFISLLDRLEGSNDPYGRLTAAGERLTDPEAPGTPALVVVDDAQWLDDESMAFVHHLCESERALVLLTMRMGSPRSWRTMNLARSVGLVPLELLPLSRAESTRLVSAVAPELGPADAHWLCDVIEGNPLFLREVVGQRIAGGSTLEDCIEHAATHGLAELVEERLGDLDPGQLMVTELLTVGGSVPMALAGECAGEGGLIALERQGLIVVVESGRRFEVQFAHPIYGEVIKARMGPAARRARRAKLSAEIERWGARRQSDLVNSVAWAMDQGDPVDPARLLAAANWLVGLYLGNDMEMSRYAPPSGGGFLRAAARMAKAAAPTGGFAAAAGWFEIETHRDPTSADAAESAALMATYIDDDELTAAQVAVAMAAMGRQRGEPYPLDVLDRLEELSAAAKGHAAMAMLDASLAVGWLSRGCPEVSMAKARAVLNRVGSSTRVRLVAMAPLATCLVWSGDPFGALGLLDECRALVGRDESPWALAALAGPRAAALVACGRVVEAADLTRSRLIHAAACGNASERTALAVDEAALELLQGRSETALQGVTALLGDASYTRILRPDLVLAVAVAVHANALLGGERTRIIEPTVPHGDAEVMRVGDAATARAAAWRAVADGCPTAAIALLEASVAAREGGVPGQMDCFHDLVRLGTRGLAGRMRSASRRSNSDLWSSYVEHAAALDSGSGDRMDAAALRLAQIGLILSAAETATSAASAHTGSGDTVSAHSSGERSARWAAACEGARTPGLGPAGERRPALNDRELEVARLAASGLSDRAIAAELYLSVRTVGTYLHRTYQKLGITSRSELASRIDR